MDLISTRAMDITKLAMDGLMMRQKAITANTANVMTPQYQRKEVHFESQLKEIITKDDLKQYIKEQNSIQYSPNSLDLVMNRNDNSSLTLQQARYVKSNLYEEFSPQVIDDNVSGSDSKGNNVNLEAEVMDMASVGIKYNVLATLEQKQMRMISGAIKGDIV